MGAAFSGLIFSWGVSLAPHATRSGRTAHALSSRNLGIYARLRLCFCRHPPHSFRHAHKRDRRTRLLRCAHPRLPSAETPPSGTVSVLVWGEPPRLPALSEAEGSRRAQRVVRSLPLPT